MQTNSQTLLACILIFAVHEGTAQVPGALEQVDAAQQRRMAEQSARVGYHASESAPELFPGESSDVGPQSVLKIKARKTWFEAQADVQYFYTDNMFLTEHNKQETGVLVSTAQFALAPTPYELGQGRFSPRLGYRHQWYDFGLDGQRFDSSTIRLNQFDFNAQTIFTDGQWAHENWISEVGFDFTRLLSTADYDEFYKEYVPRWGIQRLFPLDDKTVISLGYEGDYRFSEGDTVFDKDFNDRTDHAFFAGCTRTLCRQAVIQPYYRFKYTHFTSGVDRQDYLHSFGVALYCFFTPQISVRAFVGYDLKSSDGRNSVSDYDRLDAGGGVNLTIRF
jgi:hypothetical protein